VVYYNCARAKAVRAQQSEVADFVPGASFWDFLEPSGGCQQNHREPAHAGTAAW
jgi:hypothetical protein